MEKIEWENDFCSFLVYDFDLMEKGNFGFCFFAVFSETFETRKDALTVKRAAFHQENSNDAKKPKIFAVVYFTLHVTQFYLFIKIERKTSDIQIAYFHKGTPSIHSTRAR